MTSLAGDYAAAAALTAAVIAAEAAAGLSIPTAVRPLLPHEITASTRFGDLSDANTAAQDAVKPLTDRWWQVLIGRLMTDIFDHSDDTVQLRARLNELTAAPALLTPAAIAELREEVHDALVDEVVKAGLDWAVLTRAEALRQGVAEHLLPAVNELTATPAMRAAATVQVEDLLGATVTRVLGVAQATIRTSDPSEADAAWMMDNIRAALTGVSHAGVDDLARQAILTAAGRGRLMVVDKAKKKPEWVYASELLDERTCGPCAAIDGTRWATVAEGTSEYPGGAGYRHCEGGLRCRGTLVYVWPTEAAPTVE